MERLRPDMIDIHVQGEFGHWSELLSFGNRVVEKDAAKAMALICRENADRVYLEFLDPKCFSMRQQISARALWSQR
jgi:hypothetical protein